MHLIALHDSAGSGNPLGVSGNYDRLPFAPYFIFKDLITIFIFILVLSLFVFFMPNILGDSENYVMANPMQTPPAIEINLLWWNSPLAIALSICFFTKQKDLYCEPVYEQALFLNNNNTKISKPIKGFITIKNKKQEITKTELLTLIELAKKDVSLKAKAGLYHNNNRNNFKELVNGVFQAQGHVGGYFPTVSSITFRPVVYISQNASDWSIKFLALLWLFLDKKFEFIISQNDASKYFHIRIHNRNWGFIVTKIIPYLSSVYGDKYKGLLSLKEMISLLINKVPFYSEQTKIRVIDLAYSLVYSPKKKLDKSEKIFAVLGRDLKVQSANSSLYIDNRKPLTIPFILGLLLGDGNFDITIRNAKKGILFIPRIRLEQKYTVDNSNLLNNIVEFLNKLNIHSNITTYAKSPSYNHIVLTAEGNLSISNFIKSIEIYTDLYFWKQPQIDKLKKSLIITSVAARHWKQSKIALLKFLYSNNSSFDLNYLIKKLDDLYCTNQKPSGVSKEFYITLSKDKSWAVNLPTRLKIKPKTKYLFFKTFNGSKQEALNAAIDYRNKKLDGWLLDNGFISS